MNSLKKILFTFKVNNVIDIITNSSSELFVLEGETKEIVTEMISNVYPDFVLEYEPIQDVRTMSNDDIDSFLNWHLGLKRNGWSGSDFYNKESDYVTLPNIPFNELYDTTKPLKKGEEWEIINNIPEDLRRNAWDRCYVTDENRDKVIAGIEESVGRFFLYSLDENPNWEFQEKLMEIGDRYHLG